MSGTKNEVVAIAGASSGIGEATALLLVERGATVVLGARGLDRLAALADRMVRTEVKQLTRRPTSDVAMISPVPFPARMTVRNSAGCARGTNQSHTEAQDASHQK
jgi:NADP-dependent 3-hydroxy acid dehydrogenase YdfG